MSLKDINEYYKNVEPRGEYVLIVSGAPDQKETYTLDEAIKLAKKMQKDNNLSPSLAAKEASKLTNIPKGEIYKGLL